MIPAGAQPYRTTPVFDEQTLPAALRREHSTKEGVWGLIRVLEGRQRLTCLDPHGEQWLTPSRPGMVLPAQPHFVTPEGPVKMQVEFYDRAPDVAPGDCECPT